MISLLAKLIGKIRRAFRPQKEVRYFGMTREEAEQLEKDMDQSFKHMEKMFDKFFKK